MNRDNKSELLKIEDLKRSGAKIVFTNGCFDILHRGHVEYLESAGAMGDVLVVGLNSDDSIRRIKGNGRPIVSEDDRKAVLEALRVVDFVVIFEEDTPEKLIESIAPDILVKGADWPIEDIIGAQFVINNGGEVRTIELVEGRSTSNIIEKILRTEKEGRDV